MFEDKPYIDYKFLGVTSFLESLDESGVRYEVLERNPDAVFAAESAFLKEEDDLVLIGVGYRDDKPVYFAEFGILIAPNILSYIVFLYDEKPKDSDLLDTLNDIEGIVLEGLKNSEGAPPTVPH